MLKTNKKRNPPTSKESSIVHPIKQKKIKYELHIIINNRKKNIASVKVNNKQSE